MRKGRSMNRNDLCFHRYIFSCVFVLIQAFSVVYSQDVLPDKAKNDHNSYPVYSSSAMERLMRFISVSNPMPSSFKDTMENVITDPKGGLCDLWEKILTMDHPVRIVHIGDSHVRGHVFPYTMRKLLEEDFGSEAVMDYDVSYHTTGIAQETGRAGIVYHILGVNGATCASFNKPDRISEITSLNPDLIILSFGTNEAHGRSYNITEHRQQMMSLVRELRKGCVNAGFLLTTPPGAYIRSGRRNRIVNARTPLIVRTEKDFAIDNGIAVWDLYDIVGGERFACKNWTAAGMYQKDKIHFTRDGYTLQGLLIHEAFIKAYNDYVATKVY